VVEAGTLVPVPVGVVLGVLLGAVWVGIGDPGTVEDRVSVKVTVGPVPPVISVPLIGMGSVMGVETDELAPEDRAVVVDPEEREVELVVELDPPVIRVIANDGLALPESPNKTMI